ncbi:hypothetical protein NC661_18070 [Aquibacillus koreensis]|uniref:Uncharacterized protein n=1 Tax=Aquibacillus koreensis TaxID=279446 RepID=A0A9X4ALA8_9BACI|nr:hypothetical protein [Aquibacillus koreensis]MCT2535425.1 hypothetical protein [Aquibacillus koreensis]MDC3422260.1 hypothetical protein [Aquibacillus koreensis]
MNSPTLVKKSKETNQETYSFSYHKKSGYIGFICAMLVVIVIETVAISFLLYNWSPLLHWIHLLLAIVMFVFLIVDLQAVIRNPIELSGDTLSIKIGVRPKLTIKTDNIKEILNGNINYEQDKKNKEVLDLSLLGLDDPTFEIVLHEPVAYRKNSKLTRIFITVDEKETLYKLLKT